MAVYDVCPPWLIQLFSYNPWSRLSSSSMSPQDTFAVLPAYVGSHKSLVKGSYIPKSFLIVTLKRIESDCNSLFWSNGCGLCSLPVHLQFIDPCGCLSYSLPVTAHWCFAFQYQQTPWLWNAIFYDAVFLLISSVLLLSGQPLYNASTYLNTLPLAAFLNASPGNTTSNNGFIGCRFHT